MASQLGNQDFTPWHDLEAPLLASSSPISSAKEADSGLQKGWVLNSEDDSKSELADILLWASGLPLFQDSSRS